MKKPMISTKGLDFGVCNICGDSGKLTEDHTPPKKCIRITQVELFHIIDHLDALGQREIIHNKGRRLMNGVKYKTLCEPCNSKYLGSLYDPAFIYFVNTVGEFLKSTLILPRMIPITIEPQKIMRSLIGHLSAQGVNRYKKGENTIPIKDYILNSSKSLPEDLNIYYWLYPYKYYLMARDFGYLDTRDGKSCAMWLIKFFPIAFLVTFAKPEEWGFHVNELSLYRDKPIDYKAKEYISLTNIPHPMWPEAPSDENHNVVLYGQEAITSYELKPKRR